MDRGPGHRLGGVYHMLGSDLGGITFQVLGEKQGCCDLCITTAEAGGRRGPKLS